MSRDDERHAILHGFRAHYTQVERLACYLWQQNGGVSERLDPQHRRVPRASAHHPQQPTGGVITWPS